MKRFEFPAFAWASAVLLSACAGGARPEQPAPMVVTEPVEWSGDVDLAPVLVRPQLGPVEMGAAERIELRLGPLTFAERLGIVVEDTTAPWLVRVNALRLLATRGALAELPVFVKALRARDERVRIAAATGMREYMAIRPAAATEILAFALQDSSHRVQTAALQMLGDRDVDILRKFLEHARNREVRAVALDLVRAAEERGAPLVPKDSAGTLARTTANGTVLTFRPTRSWPEWDAAVGELVVTPPGGKPVVVAAGVEQVGKVVPAFFSSDATQLVYEVGREIHVRNLASGEDRKLADGIAPRVLPFTNDVIYFSENRAKRGETPNSFGLKYQVMRVPLAGGTPTSIGELGASALNELKGNYSTVRWSRVQEQEGSFVLVGELIEPFPLPSPFGE